MSKPTADQRGREDDNLKQLQLLAINSRGRGRASNGGFNASSESPIARLTRGAAARLAVDQSGQTNQGRERDQQKQLRPVVVSEKAAALGRQLLMNPLADPPKTPALQSSFVGMTDRKAFLMPAHARVAYESKRKAACAIAAAAAAGPPVTRSLAKAGRNAVTSGTTRMETITEHAPAVAIALPSCVPSIDLVALSFDPKSARLLGRGAFGVVYEGRYLGQPVAVKVQELCLQEEGGLDELSVEAVLGSSLHHPGLLRTIAASVYSYSGKAGPTHEMHMVMELMPDGSVLSVFRGRDLMNPANLLLAASTAEQVAWALDFLHNSCGMLHLDVKGANVLMRLCGSGSGFAKLADFGLTLRQHEAAEEGVRDRGTPRYMGPEFWHEDLADCIGEAADVYALGCVMWEMAHQGTEFLSDRTDAQVARAKGRTPMQMPGGTAMLNKYSALATKCRALSPADRPVVRDVALELKELCENLRSALKLQ